MKNDESIFDQVKEWEDTFRALYKRKPRMIEREQYFIGAIHGLTYAALAAAPAAKQKSNEKGGDAN